MARQLRIECEQRVRAGGILTDLRTGKQAWFYRGEAIVLELALFANGAMKVKADLTTIKVRWRNPDGSLISETIVNNSNLNANITAQQWRQGNASLARVSFSTSATGALPAGMITLEVLASDVLYASGTVEGVTQVGLEVGEPPEGAIEDFYTKTEADATFELAGASVGLAADIGEIVEYLGSDIEGVGKFVMATAQSWTEDEKAQARANIGAVARADDALEIGGDPASLADQTIGDQKYSMAILTPTASAAYLRLGDFRTGTPYLLSIQQGFVVHWTDDFIFPPHEITFGNSTGDFAKKTWHPATGETVDSFELVRDASLEGGPVRVRRLRRAAVPDTAIDWHAENPFIVHNGSSFTSQYDRHGRTIMTASSGTTLYAALAGSSFKGWHYDGTASQSFPIDPPIVACGFAVAMVFTANAATGQRVLFSSDAMGIKIVADTDGIRLQAFAGGAGTGLLIATTYNAAPIAFVAVVRPGSAGAYVLTTDPGGGGQTGSFTPTAAVPGGYGRFGWQSGSGNALNCKIARCQIYRTGLNYDQARAVLDSLTSYYQIG